MKKFLIKKLFVWASVLTFTTIVSTVAIFSFENSFNHETFADLIDVAPNKTEELESQNKKNVDPNTVWMNVNSMKTPNGGATNDGIFVDFVLKANEKPFYDLQISFIADLAPKNNSVSVLNEFVNKDLVVKIIDKNGKKVATKTAEHFLNDEGKHVFSFKLGYDELASNVGREFSENYKLEVYCDEKLVGTFNKRLEVIKNPGNDESLKIQATDGTKTSDLVTIISDKHNNIYLGLIYDLKNNKSIFEGKNLIRIDFVDNSGKVAMSKTTTSPKKCEKPGFCSAIIPIEKSEVSKKLDLQKGYNLKFYDEHSGELLGTKFLKNLKTPKLD